MKKYIPLLKIGLALIFALLVALLFVAPKKNDIPVLPVALELHLSKKNESLILIDSKITEGYPPDYQTDIENNYYKIQILKNDEVLFTGKTITDSITIRESESPENNMVSEPLTDFTLDLPYYKNADQVIITNDKGKKMISINLSELNLAMPATTRKTCGDGICSDNENILMCHTDCLKGF
jgi:hypothetical protein